MGFDAEPREGTKMPVPNHRDRRSRSIGTAGQIHKILFACARGASPRSFLHPSSKMIVDGLADRGHQVRAVTVGDNEMIETSSHLEGKTISPPNIYWKYWAPRPLWKKIVWHALENGNPRALIRMGREFRDYKPDVIITISIENIATWLAARLGKLPVVHVLQNDFLMCGAES